MAIDHRQLYTSSDFAQQDVGQIRRIVRELAPQDWLVLAYLIALNVACLQAPESGFRAHCLERVFGLLVFLVTTLIVVRGSLLKNSFWAPLVYRLAIYGTVQLSYFFFHELLPVVNAGSLDAELYHLDLTVFGFEPAMALDRFVNPITTEWFKWFLRKDPSFDWHSLTYEQFVKDFDQSVDTYVKLGYLEPGEAEEARASLDA